MLSLNLFSSLPIRGDGQGMGKNLGSIVGFPEV